MAKIAQLLPNRISGHLIFERKTNSYSATIIGVSFRCAYRSISKKKIIDNRINKAHRVDKTTEIELNLTHSVLKATEVDDRV